MKRVPRADGEFSLKIIKCCNQVWVGHLKKKLYGGKSDIKTLTKKVIR